MSPTTRTNPIRVVFVAFEGMSLLDLSGPLEVFRSVALHPDYADGKSPYETHVVSAEGGPVMTFDGLALMTAPLEEPQRAADRHADRSRRASRAGDDGG